MVSLHATPERLIQIRQNRLLSMGAASGSRSDTYIDKQSVTEEVAFGYENLSFDTYFGLSLIRGSETKVNIQVMKTKSGFRRLPALIQA